METVQVKVGNREISIETGRIARQAHGAVVVRSGDTMVFVAACRANAKEGTDFFPLTIDYREKTYAAGFIPGGYFKREARPSEHEILTMRLTDRPLRPLFPDHYRDEVQVMAQVISSDGEVQPDILSMIGASAALAISEIPLLEPLGAVRVGMIDGQFIANPTFEQMKESRLNLVMSGTETAIMMVEGASDQLTEQEVLAALKFGHEAIKPLIQMQNDLVARCGKPKIDCPAPQIDQDLYTKVKGLFEPKVDEAFAIHKKHDRDQFLTEAKAAVVAQFEAAEEAAPGTVSQVKEFCYKIEKDRTRQLMVKQQKRADGRGLEDIRPITCETGVLPRAHGSALFTRGETQALVAVTLGTADDEQMIDSLTGLTKKQFMLHYNFPPFSVGECRPVRGVGRREIGHGHLAERSLEAVRPDHGEFPYTIRVVSDIMESNGSSSMASVCGGSLALMDAGVPVTAAVSGIAMGLIKEGDDFLILSDIIGLEDHLGDMDFKVTGTGKGITAFQMDIKITGITFEIMEKALGQAKSGREHIASKMNAALSAARPEMSPYAPRLVSFHVPTDKIKDVIGPGGKVIKGIIEQTGVKINIDDSGLVVIASADANGLNEAVNMVKGLVEEPEVGKVYNARVVKIMDFGAFVEFLPGKEGLVHISQISPKRIDRVEDELSEGQQVRVKLIEIDKMGRKSLSIKAVDEE